MKKKNHQTCNFGEHLTIDGYGGKPEKLNDQKLVKKCLDELPGILGMKKLSQPVILRVAGNGIKDPGGWSGFVIIAESHISIHTFPARKFVSIDAYTCRNGLPTGFVINYFREMFGLEDVEKHFIRRGTKYPVDNIA